jgi:hypothetical protein
MHAPHSIGVADNDDSRLLALQSEYWEAFTLDALRRAGIAPGMRVLRRWRLKNAIVRS